MSAVYFLTVFCLTAVDGGSVVPLCAPKSVCGFGIHWTLLTGSSSAERLRGLSWLSRLSVVSSASRLSPQSGSSPHWEIGAEFGFHNPQTQVHLFLPTIRCLHGYSDWNKQGAAERRSRKRARAGGWSISPHIPNQHR